MYVIRVFVHVYGIPLLILHLTNIFCEAVSNQPSASIGPDKGKGVLDPLLKGKGESCN